MSKNSAPLFFFIIITSIFVSIGFYINKDVETYATRSNTSEEVETSSNDTLEDTIPAMDNKIVEKTESISDAEIESEIKEYSFQPISEDYFDDALFIGDSRTVGLKKYANLGNASFYSETGLTIHNIFDKEIQEDTISEVKLSLEEVLTQRSYGKIYLMVGINELGRGTAETYFEEYQKVLSRIQELQPNALFFIEGNMNVTKEKSDNDPIFNNTNISDRNKKIASLEDKKTIFYLDVNEVITDENGYLVDEYTFDDIHLKAKYYPIWKEFLLNHGIQME